MIETEKIVLFVIFLIVLVVGIYILVSIVKPQGEQLTIQNQIRQCCTLFRAYGCCTACNDFSIVPCGDSNIDDLIKKISMTKDQLKLFCGC